MANIISNCPICTEAANSEQPAGGADSLIVTCSRCGEFQISQTALATKKTYSPIEAAILSHAIWQHQRHGNVPLLSTTRIEELLDERTVPDPMMQAENLLDWIVESVGQDHGKKISEGVSRLMAIAGSVSIAGMRIALQDLAHSGYIELQSEANRHSMRILLPGWKYYYESLREQRESRQALMAMSFRNGDVARAYSEAFRPAAARAGFKLIRIDENAPAGLIDNRLRVELRRSRFVVADLTEQNAGAYWEAGFAEGLGREVIYTCERGYFKNSGTHFDTNHSHTIRWTIGELDKAADELVCTIRSTFPGDAILEDKSE